MLIQKSSSVEQLDNVGDFMAERATKARMFVYSSMKKKMFIGAGLLLLLLRFELETKKLVCILNRNL
jgi:hypothetical protein